MNNNASPQYTVVCSICGTKLPKDAWWRSECGNSTRVVYKNKSKHIQFPLDNPVDWDGSIGNTPLLYLSNISKLYGCKVYAKCENQNLTGSFKDRGSVIEIQKAKELNKKGIVCASTGNMAVSLSAAAAKAKLRCIDVIPKRTSNVKIELMKRCGGQTILVDGSYDDCVGQALKFSQKNNYFLCGDYTLRREGQKTIGWELARSGISFDALVIPVGNGNLGTAIYQGWQEARPDAKLPAFIGVQPSLCNPLTKAWKSKKDITSQSPAVRTQAAAFDVGNPLDGPAILSIVQKTSGMIIDATDTEMLSGRQLLAQKEGILGEITVGSTIAAIKKLKTKLQNKTILIIISGSGLSGN